MVQTPLTGLLSALAGFATCVFQASITIGLATIEAFTGNAVLPETEGRASTASLSVFMYDNAFTPAAMEFSSVTKIRNLTLTMIPITTIFDDTLCSVQGVHNRDTSQYFMMIHPDFLPGKLEELEEEYSDLIVMNISDPAAAVRLAELCCQSGIPFITLALFSETEHLKELIEASSIPAVILPTEAATKTKHEEEQEKILIDGIRATTFLAEKVAEGTSGCFLREHLPA